MPPNWPKNNPKKIDSEWDSFRVGNTLCLCRSSWVSSLKPGRLASLSSLVGINASLGSASFSEEEEAAATTINGRWSLLPLPSTSLPCSLRPLTKSNRENKKKRSRERRNKNNFLYWIVHHHYPFIDSVSHIIEHTVGPCAVQNPTACAKLHRFFLYESIFGWFWKDIRKEKSDDISPELSFPWKVELYVFVFILPMKTWELASWNEKIAATKSNRNNLTLIIVTASKLWRNCDKARAPFWFY